MLASEGARTSMRGVDELILRTEEYITRHRLLDDGERVLVAVSGGVDSMVLLHVLHSLAPGKGWELTVAHFNHRLRGRAAEADARFVERAAKKLGLECVVESAEVKQQARERKLSVEMAARALRHEFLARTAGERRARAIALAHHADDQVELFFLRLLRGASSEGLAGMRPSSPSPVADTLRLVRPLLEQGKGALAEFAGRTAIAFREDASNRSTDILRNRVRQKLLPMLREEFQPGVDAVTLRTMEVLRAEGEFVRHAAQQWLERSARPPFARIEAALQRRILQIQLHQAGFNVEFERIEHLRLSPLAWVTLQGKQLGRVTVEGRLEIKSGDEPDFIEGEKRISLGEHAGEAVFGSWRFTWALGVGPRPGGKKQTEFFDADAVGSEIVLRHWRAGDRFQPIGMSHAVKLQDLFVNQKVSRNSRYGKVIATTGRNQLFWVEGMRIGERYKLTPRTRRILAWTWRSI